MIATVLLTIGLLGAWVYVFIQPGVSRSFRLAVYAVIVGGVYFVWSPGQATFIANVLGIGRGADLVSYIWILVSLAVMINLHLKLRRNLVLITLLARHIAMAQPLSLPPSASDGGMHAGNEGEPGDVSVQATHPAGTRA